MNNISKFAWTATPLLLVLLCVGLYAFFSSRFVTDGDTAANMISSVKSPESYEASSKRITNLNANIDTLSNTLKERKERSDVLKANIAEAEQKIDCLKVVETYVNQNVAVTPEMNCDEANTNFAPGTQTVVNSRIQRIEIAKTRAVNELTSVQTNTNATAALIVERKDDIFAIRKQFTGRYSNRVLWIFLTALFIILVIGAVIVGCHVIFKSNRIFEESIPAEPVEPAAAEEAKLKRQAKLKEIDRHTIIWTSAIAVIAVLFTLLAYCQSEALMQLALPIFSQSLLAPNVNEIDLRSFKFFNAIGLLGATFLIAASCVVFRRAVEVSQRTTENTDTKVKLYAILLRFLRTILYVGTLMLFIGILRMSFIMKWHLTFITTNPTDEPYKLLYGFWENVMTVQGGFYTIVLAAIYLPAAYWISGRISEFGKTQTELTSAGVDFKYTDIIFKLLAIVSPLIASGLGGNEWLNLFQ